MTQKTYITHSAEETFKIGEKLALSLRKGDIVLLSGDLGSGKTCFVQGLGKALHIRETISSPTYVYIHSYSLKKNMIFYHIDLYRVEKDEKLQLIGIEDILFDDNSIIAVEWPAILTKNYSLAQRRVIDISLERQGEDERKIVIREGMGK